MPAFLNLLLEVCLQTQDLFLQLHVFPFEVFYFVFGKIRGSLSLIDFLVHFRDNLFEFFLFFGGLPGDSFYLIVFELNISDFGHQLSFFCF